MSEITTTRLQEAEQRIEAARRRFVFDVGQELQTIRDERLYRAAGFTDFDTYCRQRWDMSKTSANRLIAAAGVIDNLAPIGATLPTNEAQARPLAKLGPEQQRTAWQLAVDTAPGGKVTAAHVQLVATSLELAAAVELANMGELCDSLEQAVTSALSHGFTMSELNTLFRDAKGGYDFSSFGAGSIFLAHLVADISALPEVPA